MQSFLLSSLASTQKALRSLGVSALAGDAGSILWLGALVASSIWAARWLSRRAITLRARAFLPTASRHLAHWVGPVDYSLDQMLRADGADARFAERRRAALMRLSGELSERYARSNAWGERARDGFSDLRFTDANRVPFPFAKAMREQFSLCSVVTGSKGPRLRDLDENWMLDVSGSYGVNVAGYDLYKQWMRAGLDRVADVGPVLGPLHPLVLENVATLKQISGLDEVSFHMSGTEAVMAAVRMARHNTGRRHIVSFSGAYHGWWDGVQPGLGSERALPDCILLKDMHRASLDVIRWRANEIAGVLVNPVQCFHPNAPPPSDAVLLMSEARKTESDSERYAAWLREVREVCSRYCVPLIFDEVYTGFRLAPGGAQEYFDIQADMVVYGKSVAGGMPIGAVCGRSDLMRRFDPEHPMRVAYVIGTFSAHPVVMGAMREFLEWATCPDTASSYSRANRQCHEWAHTTNAELEKEGLPVRISQLGTIWTLTFLAPGRYNWLMQYYLRSEGLNLSWVGTGRCLTSLDFTPEDYRELGLKISIAARRMQNDAWWLDPTDDPRSERNMKKQLAREMIQSLIRVPTFAKSFTSEVLRRKRDDHHASHNNYLNQVLHLISSSVFIYCYAAAWVNLTTAMWMGLSALLLRQLGHVVFEPPCHDKESLLLGFTTRNKSLIVAGYLLTPVAHLTVASSFTWSTFVDTLPAIAWHWFLFTLFVVFGRVFYLVWQHGAWNSSIWFVKLVTDPFSDLVAYTPALLRRA